MIEPRGCFFNRINEPCLLSDDERNSKWHGKFLLVKNYASLNCQVKVFSDLETSGQLYKSIKYKHDKAVSSPTNKKSLKV